MVHEHPIRGVFIVLGVTRLRITVRQFGWSARLMYGGSGISIPNRRVLSDPKRPREPIVETIVEEERIIECTRTQRRSTMPHIDYRFPDETVAKSPEVISYERVARKLVS
jgi:hypothetical protein